jgi:rRNA processing protein Krr1/Pno1
MVAFYEHCERRPAGRVIGEKGSTSRAILGGIVRVAVV